MARGELRGQKVGQASSAWAFLLRDHSRSTLGNGKSETVSLRVELKWAHPTEAYSLPNGRKDTS